MSQRHCFVVVTVLCLQLLSPERTLRAEDKNAVPGEDAQAVEGDPSDGFTVPVSAPSPTPAQPYLSQSPVAPLTGSQGRRLRIAGYVCAATGAAAIATGIAFGLTARAYSRNVENGTTFDPNQDSRGKRFETLQWVGYDIGASLAAVGALLYVFGRQSASQPSVALVTTVVPGGAGLAAQGAF
jgi:hypothetical protein